MARNTQGLRPPPRMTRSRAAAEQASPLPPSPPRPAAPTAGPSTPLASSEALLPPRSASPGAESSLARRRRITLRLRPRGASASAVEQPPAAVASPSPPRAASASVVDGPSLSSSGAQPLEPLFLGTEPEPAPVSGVLSPLSPARSPVYVPTSPALVPSAVRPASPAPVPSAVRSPSYSPASPTEESSAAALADLERHFEERRAACVGLSEEEQLSLWGRVYLTPLSEATPVAVPGSSTPAARAATPVYERDVQRLTPPPRWRDPRTPSPPPPDHRKPTPSEIIGWTERYEVAELLVRVAEGQYPQNWLVAGGSNAERRLQRIVMMHLTEGCMPWPSWQCRRCADLGVPCFPSAFANPYGERSRLPRVCTHCHLADVGNCVRNVPAFPGMEYPGDGTPTGRSRQRAEQANLSVVGARGPGLTRSYDRVTIPTETFGWTIATRRVFRIRASRLQLPLLRVLLRFSECWHELYSERQPHESVAVSGGPPDPLEEYVYPRDPADVDYVDM